MIVFLLDFLLLSLIFLRHCFTKRQSLCAFLLLFSFVYFSPFRIEWWSKIWGNNSHKSFWKKNHITAHIFLTSKKSKWYTPPSSAPSLPITKPCVVPLVMYQLIATMVDAFMFTSTFSGTSRRDQNLYHQVRMLDPTGRPLDWDIQILYCSQTSEMQYPLKSTWILVHQDSSKPGIPEPLLTGIWSSRRKKTDLRGSIYE